MRIQGEPQTDQLYVPPWDKSLDLGVMWLPSGELT